MAGYPDGTFGPTKEMTESQLVSILTKFDSSYKRVSPYIAKSGESSSAGYYRYFKSKQIPLAGLSDTKQRNKPITRGQFAKIIAAADGHKLTEKFAVEYLYSQGLSNGTSGKKTYEDFQPKRKLTRADAIVYLNRLDNRGTYKITGIKTNGNIADVPADFPDQGTIVFPNPTQPGATKPPASGNDTRVAAVDIDSPALIANGVDSGFITITLKDCYGNPISYDQSIPLVVRSALGASISTEQGGKVNSYTTLYTDGPDITANITAIKSTKTVTDTISFTISDSNYTGVNMSCYRNPVNVKIAYEPKAELRIEHETYNWGYDVKGQTIQVKATIVRPGGEVITDYNGKVTFTSPNLNFTSNEVAFINGVARATVENSTNRGYNQFTASITQADPRYNAVVGAVTKSQTQEVYIDQPLSINYSCPRNFEVGFIIDSSASMLRNDPDRLRVSKSQEMITKLGAAYNVGSHFNAKGYLLATGNQYTVSSSFQNVTQSGGTNIIAGLDLAIDRFSANQTPKIAILLTDGKSNTNKVVSLIQKARDRNVTIYTIGLGDKSQLNEEFLDQLANSTGGSYFHVEKSRDIFTAYQTIINEVTCATPPPSCSYFNQGFITPTIRLTSSNLYMNTFMDNNCGATARVIVRFSSLEGNIDYELIDRGQNYYAIEKGSYEIANLSLFSEGKFIAYDEYGNIIGEQIVNISN